MQNKISEMFAYEIHRKQSPVRIVTIDSCPEVNVQMYLQRPVLCA